MEWTFLLDLKQTGHIVIINTTMDLSATSQFNIAIVTGLL